MVSSWEDEFRRTAEHRGGGMELNLAKVSMSPPNISVKIVDAALLASLCATPLLMAGRHPLGQAVLVILSATAAAAWAVGQTIRPSATFRPTWASPLLLGGMILLVVQLIPLPEIVLQRISPALYPMLPMWDSSTPSCDRLGIWRTLSLYPAATRDGLVLFSAYAMLFCIAVQRGERLEDVERLLRWCAAAAAFVGIYGIIQYVSSNGKFFWIYEDPTSNTLDAAKANFTTRNHFAAFLALGVGPLLWWVHVSFAKPRPQNARKPGSPPAIRRPEHLRRMRHDGTRPRGLETGRPRPENVMPFVLAVCLGIVIFAGLLSLSRGGMVAIGIAFASTLALSWRSWSSNRALLAALGGAILILAMMLGIFGFDQVNHRLDDFRAGSLERLDHVKSRRSIWIAVARGIRQFPIIGTGVGTHVEAYRAYYSPELYREAIDREFTHAENSYLQIGFETGLAGLVLLGGFMACCGVWCIGGLMRARSARLASCMAAVTGGLAATAVHALVDFIWYVPACVVMIVMLAACAANLWRLSGVAFFGNPPALDAGFGGSFSGWRLPRLAYVAFLTLFLPAVAWAIPDQIRAAWAEGPWNEYRKSLGPAETLPETTSEALEDPQRQQEVREAEQRRLRWLEQTVERHPTRARAHLRLAQTYVRLFELIQLDNENPMRVSDVRDAALRSRFPSRQALDEWLRRAVGDHARYLDLALHHARWAASLCPLQGHAYLYLAELGFLENAGESWKKACIAQALRVRPYDGDVLDTAAAEAIAAGDHDHWVELVSRLLQCSHPFQQRWIERLVRSTAQEALPDLFQAFVQTFQPNAEVLHILLISAQAQARPEQLFWLRGHYAERAAETARASGGKAAVRWWNEARQNYAAIGDMVPALQCAENAVAADPQDFEARLVLGEILLAENRPQEAERHLRWCVERRPGDQRAESRWKEAVKGRLDQETSTARRSLSPPPR